MKTKEIIFVKHPAERLTGNGLLKNISFNLVLNDNPLCLRRVSKEKEELTNTRWSRRLVHRWKCFLVVNCLVPFGIWVVLSTPWRMSCLLRGGGGQHILKWCNLSHPQPPHLISTPPPSSGISQRSLLITRDWDRRYPPDRLLLSYLYMNLRGSPYVSCKFHWHQYITKHRVWMR